MNDTCLREIIVVVTGKRYPVREVYIFAIHKKCLIEQSAFVNRFSHISEVVEEKQEFVKTPTQKIRRFLYTKRNPHQKHEMSKR